MNSMTGFGKAELATRVGRFTVEVSSVNSRFLEITARLPRQFSLLEHRLRDLASARLSRGKVNIFVGFEEAENAPGRFQLNDRAARAYHRQLTALKKQLKLGGEVSVSDLVLLPDIAQQNETPVTDDVIWPAVRRAATKALTELLRMRRCEGAAMATDMERRLKVIYRQVKSILRDASQVVDKYREKLSARVGELVDAEVYDPGRLELEIALLADKSDISEECTRLVSHLDQYRRGLRAKEPVGKRLTFILQEMNREANTIASKSLETKITNAVIAVKEEVEKLRELAQNVE
jgi:uncharacterized protein (TIGR00255 family)